MHTSARFEREWAQALPKLSSVARSLARSREDAEDLLSSACLKAWSHFEQWEAEKPFCNWALRILTNCHHDQKRKASRRIRSISSDVELPETESARLDVADPQADCPVAALKAEEIVRRLLLLDPKGARRLVLLAIGMNSADIAQIEEIPIGTVRSRVFRSRQTAMRACAECLN